MKTVTYESRDEWMAARRGKITGSRLGDIIVKGGGTKDMITKALDFFGIPWDKKSKKEDLEALLTVDAEAKLNGMLPKKKGFYEVIAERLSTDPTGQAIQETPMERGTRLEPEAIEKFMEATGKKVDGSLVMWMRDENEGIAISPDGQIKEEHAAVEAKCLSSANHIEACVKKFFWKKNDWDSVPDEYREQIVQYFIVNDELQTVYMTFYDPRMLFRDFFTLTILRNDVQPLVEKYLAYERNEIKEVDAIVNFFTGF